MSMPVTSSNPTHDFFSHSFHDFHEMKKCEHYFIVHFDEFYTAIFSHNTCILSIYKKKNNGKKVC